MKTSELRNIIKEEISKILNEFPNEIILTDPQNPGVKNFTLSKTRKKSIRNGEPVYQVSKHTMEDGKIERVRDGDYYETDRINFKDGTLESY